MSAARFLVVAGLLSAVACSRYYDNSEGTLIAGSSAKETCSCVFVLKQDDERCKDYSRLIGPTQVVAFQIDHDAHTVVAMLAGWRSTARFLGQEQGCVLDSP